MPSRSPALCRRTAPKRSGHVSNLYVWITDAMLIHAIDQNQGAVTAACRRINSHAGPLESRRRASKRHMTGLMTKSHTFPSIWQFDVGPSMLQWEAPTSREHRRQKRHQLSVSGIFNTFVNWLENQGSTDKPLMPTQIPPSESDFETLHSEALAVNSSLNSISVAEEKHTEPIPSAYVPEEIIVFRLSISDANTIFDGDVTRKVYDATKTCKRSLRRRIERGDLTVEALLAALEPVDSITRSSIPIVKMTEKSSAMIRRGILYAMADVQAKNPAALTPNLWLAFFDKLCASNGNHHDIQLFWRLMDMVPSSIRDHFNPDQICKLTCRVVEALASRHNIFAHWSIRAARLSHALQKLPDCHQQQLECDMEAFLSQQDWLIEKAKRMRYAWLVIRSYDGHIGTQDFIDMFHKYLGSDFRLSGVQHWQLVLARLCARRTLDVSSRKQLLRNEYTSMHHRWSALMSHVMRSSNSGTAAMQEICILLTGIGGFSSTTQALTSPHVDKICRATIEAIALACGSHQQALELHDSIDVKPRASRARQPLWSWRIWTKYAEAIIKDPEIDPSRIWQILKLTYTPRSIFSNRELLAEERQAKREFLNQIAQWFLEAQHLNDRQTLRNIQRCMNQQRALGNDVSSRILAHVAELISRDLDKGQRGRTSRMKWLLNMVARKLGLKDARRAAMAWQGWRSTIDQINGRGW